MKYSKQFLIAVIFFSILSSCNFGKEKKDDLKTVFENINKDVLENSEAFAELEKVCDQIGHRLTGTENGKKAEQLSFDLFTKYGYTPEFFEFTTKCWQRETVEIHFYQNGEEIPVDAVSLALTPISADVTAEMVDVGNGLREDFDRIGKESIAGKIILVNLGIHPEDSTKANLHRSEKTALAIEYGASGCIFMNKVEGRVLLTGTASVTDELVLIPAVCVTYEDGMMMRERMNALTGQKNLFTAQLKMTNTFDEVQSRNVIATLEGIEKPDEWICIGGHLDSWDLAQGAIDNGIGTFAIMDAARTLNALDLKPKRTIKFIMWMGEEQGLLGSKAMIANWKGNGNIDKVKTYINLDMAANPIGFNDFGRPEWKTMFDELGKMMNAIDTVYKNTNTSEAGLHSDHEIFMLEGIPVIEQNSKLDDACFDFYHSNGDEFKLVNKDHLVNSVRFTAMLLYAIANCEEIPVKTLDSNQTRDYLIEQKLKEALVLGQEWKWEM